MKDGVKAATRTSNNSSNQSRRGNRGLLAAKRLIIDSSQFLSQSGY